MARASGASAGNVWLLLALQAAAGRSSGRVAAWRRLRRLGAVAVAPALWALPGSDEAREQLEWIRQDFESAGGRAILFDAAPADARASAALAAAAAGRAPAPARSLAAPRLEAARFRGRRWVTRPRPGVDRMATAWLVRRFVDPRARFAFAERPPGPRSRSVPFDMFGVELGHRDGRCTFEVVAERFGIVEPRVVELGRVVRAVDLGSPSTGVDAAEAAVLERLVEGLRARHALDHELLEAGIRLFEALHAAPAKPAGRTRARRSGPGGD